AGRLYLCCFACPGVAKAVTRARRPTRPFHTWGGDNMSTARRFCLAASCAILFALPPAVAHAQTGAASITGLVLDQTNVPVPGVTITATNQATNVAYTAVSNEAGNYTITSVPVGTYVVKAELTGFRSGTRRACQ